MQLSHENGQLRSRLVETKMQNDSELDGLRAMMEAMQERQIVQDVELQQLRQEKLVGAIPKRTESKAMVGFSQGIDQLKSHMADLQLSVDRSRVNEDSRLKNLVLRAQPLKEKLVFDAQELNQVQEDQQATKMSLAEQEEMLTMRAIVASMQPQMLPGNTEQLSSETSSRALPNKDEGATGKDRRKGYIKLDTFDGTGSLETFLMRLETCIEYNEWSDAER